MNVSELARPARAVGGVMARPFARVARARGWRWWALLTAECLAAAVCGVAVWLVAGVMSVPDVGEPFDVAAFQAQAIPAETNAYTLFERAAAVYKSAHRPRDSGVGMGRPLVVHPNDPGVGAWLDANREALALFVEGCEQPDALWTPQGTRGGRVPGPGLTDLVGLTMEEGARREKAGDMGGAWDCYRSVLRGARLVGRHAGLVDRVYSGFFRTAALNPLGAWVADPRTTPAQLRRALDDLYAMEALAPDDAYTLKSIYVEVMRMLRDDPGRYRGNFDMSLLINAPQRVPGALWRVAVYPMARLRAGDPERSRRVLRLMAAQELAYYETPPDRRPEPATRVVLKTFMGGLSFDFYDPWPEAPPAARAMPPGALARAFMSTVDATHTTRWSWRHFKSIRTKEASDHAAALYTVAEALYRREHNGSRPPAPEALVGPYLESLPAEGPEPPAEEKIRVLDVDRW